MDSNREDKIMMIEVKNTATGEVKWIDDGQASAMGIDTSGFQQAPKTWSQKLQDLPLIGNTLGTLISSSTGLGSAIATPLLEKQTGRQQQEALKLARLAQTETDPAVKADLLQRSRDLSQGAGEKATRYADTVRSGVGYFADKESPTGFGEKMGAYGPQALRTGVEVGTLLMPGVTSIAGKLPTTALGRIALPATTVGTTSALSGFAKGDDKQLDERIVKAFEDGSLGVLLGGAFGVGKEAVKWTAGGGFGKLADKLNLPKKWLGEVEKISKEVKPKIDVDKLKLDMIDDAEKLPSGIRENVIKRIETEEIPTETLWDLILKKRGAGYAPNLRSSQFKYNEILRKNLRDVIHTTSQSVAGLDKKLSKYYSVSEPVQALLQSKLMRIIGVGKVLEAILR
jgi:hypothetical protein